MSRKNICLYFQVHQPYRISPCSFFYEPGDEYFKGPQLQDNEKIFNKVAEKCYLPATRMFLDLINRYPDFALSYSFSGVFLEQCLEFSEKGQEIIDLFSQLVDSQRVEILSETYFHSLSFLYSKLEFVEQIREHLKMIQKMFGVKPRVFRNTELIYSNEVAEFIRQLGFKGMLAEGWDQHLGDKSPHSLFYAKSIFLNQVDHELTQRFKIYPKTVKNLPVLLKSYKLSDDIAFRFGDKNWSQYPLTAEKFACWVSQLEGETINLFMDYETIGEHQWEETGIFDFFRALPDALERHGIGFETVSDTIESLELKYEYDVHHYLSWADTERDLSAWVDNDIQRSALEELAELEQILNDYRDKEDPVMQKIIWDFRRMQTSDHLYYMSTKYWNDGDVHKYFSPYDSPFDAYINFMNAIRALKKRITDFQKNEKAFDLSTFTSKMDLLYA